MIPARFIGAWRSRSFADGVFSYCFQQPFNSRLHLNKHCSHPSPATSSCESNEPLLKPKNRSQPRLSAQERATCPAACRAPWRPSERPWCALFGALLNPTFPPSTTQALELVEAERALGRPIIVLKGSTDGELDAALATLARQGIVAMLVAAAPFFDTRRDKIIAFAAQQKLPAIYHFREYALAGGLIECRPAVPL